MNHLEVSAEQPLTVKSLLPQVNVETPINTVNDETTTSLPPLLAGYNLHTFRDNRKTSIPGIRLDHHLHRCGRKSPPSRVRASAHRLMGDL